MKIISAPWELDNIGKIVIEIQISKEDMTEQTIDMIQKRISEENPNYIVVKIPTSNVKLLLEIQKYGFRFIENQITVTKDLREFVWTDEDNKEDIYLSLMKTESELESVLLNITNQMFRTDRIATDPLLGCDLANNRYKNWIRNEFGRKDIELFQIVEKSIEKGVILAKKEPNFRVHILVSGIYEKYQGRGYGYNVVYQPTKYYAAKGMRHISTKISSNNPAVMKYYFDMGYVIDEMEYVLIKHR